MNVLQLQHLTSERKDPAALVENKQENQDHDARKKAFTDLGSKRQKTRVSELCDQSCPPSTAWMMLLSLFPCP